MRFADAGAAGGLRRAVGDAAADRHVGVNGPHAAGAAGDRQLDRERRDVGNQPATAGSAATVASGSNPGLRTWTVTGQVQSMYNAGVQQGFLIRDAAKNASASPEQAFNSRTAGANRPQLVLTFAPAP